MYASSNLGKCKTGDFRRTLNTRRRIAEIDSNESAIKGLIADGGKLTHELLSWVVPGQDIEAGVLACRKFLDREL